MMIKRKPADRCARCGKITDEVDCEHGGWGGTRDALIDNTAWLCKDCANLWSNVWYELQVDGFNAFIANKPSAPSETITIKESNFSAGKFTPDKECMDELKAFMAKHGFEPIEDKE